MTEPTAVWTSYGTSLLPCGANIECSQLRGERVWRATMLATDEVSNMSREDAKRRLADKLRRAADELESDR